VISRHDPGLEVQELLLTKPASAGDWPKAVFYDASWRNIKSLVMIKVKHLLPKSKCGISSGVRMAIAGYDSVRRSRHAESRWC
jgi:hypothetical protein